MKSMTGFGRATTESNGLSVCIDVSSVNKKGLEISASMPRDWSPMERLIASKLRNFYERGKVNVAIRAEMANSSAIMPSPEQLSEATAELKKACELVGTDFNPTADTLLKIADTLRQNSASLTDWEEAWQIVEPALAEALQNADDMRCIEGSTLKSDITSRLATISKLVEQAELAAKDSPAKYREKLLSKLSEAGLEIDLNDERVLKEICIFADRCDISEEITRLKSHIGQFLATMEATSAVGRKMDFICQEMGREINTSASKANNLDLTKITIELKNELERIREQIQNIE